VPAPRRLRTRPVIAVVLVLLLIAGAAIATVGHSRAARGDFTFLNTAPDGSPYRWNPCEPIHFVVNLTGAPSYALGDAREAARRVSEATGVPFADDGTTQIDVAYLERVGRDARCLTDIRADG
jgi:hypothetical protein